jgi:16S rRNA (cytidine1402-2'-O)-methyltransferase
LGTHGIETPTTSYFEHNESWKGERILDALRSGKDVALVSDAGTPGISDPGFRLVREARAEGIPVIPIPGPSAAVTALSVSACPLTAFFVGFLPHPARTAPSKIGGGPLYRFYESPVRIREPWRPVVRVRDREGLLPQPPLHEEYRRASLVPASCSPLGQVSEALVVAGAGAQVPSRARLLEILSRLD